MRVRTRPPLTLKDAEPEAAAETAAAEPAADAVDSEPQRRRGRASEASRPTRDLDRAVQAIAEPPVAAAEPELAPEKTEANAPPAPYSPPAPPATRPVAAREGARHAWVLAGVASALWVGGVASYVAYDVGAGLLDVEPLRLAIFALLALAPVGVFFMLASALRQGARLAAETTRARDLSQALLAPTALAAREAGDVLNALRGDIDQATLAVERARADLNILREALGSESKRLNEAAEEAQRTARRLSEALGKEREAMQSLGVKLDAQATGVFDAVERQSRMVADASDLAQTQLREAEAVLAARASDLAAAAVEAQDAARLAADDLSRQTLRLETAGSGVADQIRSVEEGLGQQRAALVTAAFSLRSDQEDFSAQVESQRAQLAEALSATRTAAAELGDASAEGAQSLREVAEAAADQFRALTEMAGREAEGFDHATKEALDRFESMATEARDVLVEQTNAALEALRAAADEARGVAARAVDESQARADQLGQSLFSAAQEADKAADAHVDRARRMVADAAALVDEAGDRAIARMEANLERMRDTLGAVEEAMSEIDGRAERLPEAARARIDEIKASVEDGLNALAAASRRAAEETQAVDEAFQDRVKRNYDMLSEAVHLMGVVSGDSPLKAARRRETTVEPAIEPTEPEAAAPAPSSGPFGLRGRLKPAAARTTPPVEPRARDQQAEPEPEAARDEGLSWRDLVDEGPSAEDDAPAPRGRAEDDEVLSDRVAASIRRMGVDPNALLPRARVEEAAAAFQDGEPDRARQIVRRVAPAAVRSISRRVLSAPDLKADAERYVRLYAEALHDAARSDKEGYAVLSLLASDPGRAFLLLDAAVGELA